MVGMTQRGPVDYPTLVTSFGEFSRVFGGYLDHRDFTEGRDSLPHAVEGFFNNGGQRVYITRIVGDDAGYSTADLLGPPVDSPASTTLSAQAAKGATQLRISDGTNIHDDEVLLIDDGPRSEYVTATADPAPTGDLQIFGALRAPVPANTAVVLQTVAETEDLTPQLTGNAAAGATAVPLNAGAAAALVAGQVLRIRDSASPALTEYVTVGVNGSANVNEALLFAHPQATTQVNRVTLTDDAATTTTAPAPAGADTLTVANSAGLTVNAVVRIGAGAGRQLHVLRGVTAALSIATTATQNIHAVGTRIIKQVALLRVHARSQGVWGNDVRVTVRDAAILQTTATEAAPVDAPGLKLDAVFGLVPGSVLEITTATGKTRQRVAAADLAGKEASFDGGLDVAVAQGDAVRSVEFSLIVDRLNADGKVVESENFTNLSLDPAHPRYAPRIVGAYDVDVDEPEETGESELIRLSDRTGNDARLRLATPPDRSQRVLGGGDDDLDGVDDENYIGEDSDDPEDRTGLFALKNIDSISIVAVPGRTSVDVQNAVIQHCTDMRYRFGVLDSTLGAKMAAVQKQRQNFDTTYAALYYPWLVIGDPFGRNGDTLRIPASGHTAGIFARTDVRRGVHKAPANEAVQGIRDLEFRLTKGEQDILNPNHINVVRDFRELNRGVRVWGARTLSSDPEWRYVNVRRLFLFIEKSIERGSQFAVFEPNSEALWATIKRSITDFLVGVWRDGALEGTKQAEAFFVKVDRTTMTQADIDNGRLIIIIGIAPVKPAEFVIFRISQKTREAVA
jgi:hypothetical protein